MPSYDKNAKELSGILPSLVRQKITDHRTDGIWKVAAFHVLEGALLGPGQVIRARHVRAFLR